MQSFFLQILWFFARLIIQMHRPYIIGVTGTVGKTTITTHIAKYLTLVYGEKNVQISSYHYNGEFWLPLSIIGTKTGGKNPFRWLYIFLLALYRCLRPYPKYLILEYGIDHPGEMEFLLSVATPDIAIVSPIAPNHLEQFGTLESYRQEKLLFLEPTKKRIVHESLRPYITHDALYYGSGSMSDIDASHFSMDITGVSAKIHVYKSTYDVVLPTFWAYQIENILPLYAIAYMLELDPEVIMKNASLFTPESWRSNILEGIEWSTIIDGSYNGGFESMCRLIDSVQPFVSKHRIVCLLGDMRELGTESATLHRELADYIESQLDSEHDIHFFLVGPLMCEYVAPILKSGYEVHTTLSSREAGGKIQKLLIHSKKPTIIAVKGSQNTIFLEEGIKWLLADPARINQLCRQSKGWMAKKETFFQSL